MINPAEIVSAVSNAVRVSWPSLLVAYAIAGAAGVTGVFVLLRREALLGLALPQVVAVGCALGLRFGWNPLLPSFVSVLAALLWVARSRAGGETRSTGDAQAILPCLYVGGLCLSILVIAHAGAHVEEMQTLLTGGDVFVTESQAAVATPLLVAAAGACAILWRRFLAMAQLPSAVRLAGWRPWRWEGSFLVLLAAVALIGTSTMGSMMVLSLLILPSATVLPWSRRVPHALALSLLLGIVMVTVGFLFATLGDFPFSQSVGGVGFVAVILSRIASTVPRVLRRPLPSGTG